jgi:acyl carrier protein
MTDDEIITSMTQVMREAFRKPDLAFEADRHMRDIFGLDSVQFVTLILSLEERFSTIFPEEKVDRLTTVGSLFALVRTSIA